MTEATLLTLQTCANPGESATRPLKVAFLTVMPSPYTQDLFHAMQSDGRIRPRVFYMEMTAPDTRWGKVPLPDYATVLSGFWVPFLGGRVHLNPRAVRAIAAERPDVVVVGGYMTLTTQMVMLWLRKKRLPWIFWGELPGMRHRRGLGAALRWLAQRPAVQSPDAIAAIGTRAVAAYGRMAREGCRIANIPYCCDVKPFLDICRNEGILTNRTRFLFCGQLIHRKGVDLLVDEFCRAAREVVSIELTLIGDGPLRRELEQRIPDALRHCVHFAGFQPVAELPRFFGNADVFILPSRHDGWGVVVNQAIAAGLPVICSDSVGAADLVVENANGHVIPTANSKALYDAIVSFAKNPSLGRQFGARSREYAREWTPEQAVDRWYRLCDEVLSANTMRVR